MQRHDALRYCTPQRARARTHTHTHTHTQLLYHRGVSLTHKATAQHSSTSRGDLPAVAGRNRKNSVEGEEEGAKSVLYVFVRVSQTV